MLPYIAQPIVLNACKLDSATSTLVTSHVLEVKEVSRRGQMHWQDGAVIWWRAAHRKVNAAIHCSAQVPQCMQTGLSDQHPGDKPCFGGQGGEQTWSNALARRRCHLVACCAARSECCHTLLSPGHSM